MPFAPAKPCAHQGCGALTHGRYCEAHAQSQRRRIDEARGSSASRGYGRRWRKARKRFLIANPLCREHEKGGEVVAANEVDHIIPHKGDDDLFWDEDNWQSLCNTCHASKTAREDGGWGRGASES